MVPNLSKSETKNSVLALVPYYTDYRPFSFELIVQPGIWKQSSILIVMLFSDKNVVYDKFG